MWRQSSIEMNAEDRAPGICLHKCGDKVQLKWTRRPFSRELSL